MSYQTLLSSIDHILPDMLLLSMVSVLPDVTVEYRPHLTRHVIVECGPHFTRHVVVEYGLHLTRHVYYQVWNMSYRTLLWNMGYDLLDMLLLSMDYILQYVIYFWVCITSNRLLFVNCGPCTTHVIYCQVWAIYIGHQPHSENAVGKQPPAPHLNSFRTVLTTYTVKSPSFRLPCAEIFMHL